MKQPTNVYELLKTILTEESLLRITISNPRKNTLASKVQIRPIQIKQELAYQMTTFIAAKVYHNNYDADTLYDQMIPLITKQYKQTQIQTKQELITILSNKHEECTIRRKASESLEKPIDYSHNRTKQYIIEEGIPVPFLIDLGVMTKEGKVIKAKYDKFKQINRFLEFIEDILPELPDDREITIFDFGCGKSYLTFAIFYYLNKLKGYDVRIIGLDLKEDVIQRCQKLAQAYHYDKLSFLVGDMESYEGTLKADMVVTLHACDTATDYALSKAVTWGAKVILSVPCCQHELNKQIHQELLAPILSYGIIKERMAALMTDALRAQYLEGQGYRTQLLEFIDMEHTPKNILIRGIFTGKCVDNRDQINNITQSFHINPKLETLLVEQGLL